MHRTHRNLISYRRRLATAGVFLVACLHAIGSASADLIRSSPGLGYPEIAGNVSGSQTYSYDPVTRTGTFQLINAPHSLELGPGDPDMIPILPNPNGRLEQSLRVVLDDKGRLVDQPSNSFQLHGTVVIGDQTYDGILLEGRPTSFGARTQVSSSRQSATDAFDLNMKITGGKLAEVFGDNAYLRIIPQADSTFRGEFTSDFSGGKPLTDLRSNGEGVRRPAPVPEPATILVFLAIGLIVLLGRMSRDSTV
jgi:hypothetical protein